MDCVELLEEETVEGMQAEEHEHEEHGHEAEYDEHVWTSPRNATLICEDSRSAVRGRPGKRRRIQCEPGLLPRGACEARRRVHRHCGGRRAQTIIFADRFPLLYFARLRPDVLRRSPGCSEDAEPSAATVAFIIDKVREEDIPIVFHRR